MNKERNKEKKKNPKTRERMKIETPTYLGDRIGYTTVRDVE